LRPWLLDVAERMQCPLDFPVVGALVSFASLTGRRVGIRPKKQDDWLVVPNLWGAIIGRPGIMKTPALAEAMRPLLRLAIEAQKQHEEALKEFPAAKMMADARRDVLNKEIKDSLKNNTSGQGILERVKVQLAECEQAARLPLQARYIVNDPTVEKLGELLNENPNGLLLFRDELPGWLRTLDREGHENDRAFYNEAWNGTQSYTYDRIGRGTLHIKAACVSLLGGIQPGPLSAYLRGAVQGGLGDDGLIQRLQLLVYPDDSSEWRNVDRWPNTAAKNKAYEIFQNLASLDPLTIKAKIADGEEVPFLRFSPQAQEWFNQWRVDLEQKLRTKNEHPALESHLSKYRSLMPSLALLFHLIAVLDGDSETIVSFPDAERAAAWCDYLESHARRIYQSVTQSAIFSARKLAERIRAQALPSPFPLGAVLRKNWAGLATLEEVKEAVFLLEELHWIHAEKTQSGDQGGRPRFHYHVNPLLTPEEAK
jgi:hypothetical protein